MTQTTAVILIAIEGTGLLITIGFAIAAYKGYKKSKRVAEDIKTRVNGVVSEMEMFAQRLRTLIS